MALVTRIPALYTASGVLPHALFLSLSLRGGEESSFFRNDLVEEKVRLPVRRVAYFESKGTSFTGSSCYRLVIRSTKRRGTTTTGR